MKEIVVGIDLGTTYSAIGYVGDDAVPRVIRNSDGDILTPSVVLLDSGVPVVGIEAKEEQAIGNENVASCFKLNMSNPKWTFFADGKEYTAKDLSSFVLSKLKQDAEAGLGCKISKAIITVPAYFGNTEREATREAGRMAGLDVLGLLNEPTAAAFAYGMAKCGCDKKKLLVYDLGGGTFDVTIVQIQGNDIDCLSTDGDHNLGGRDWDEAILDYMRVRFENDYGFDPVSDSTSKNDLYVKCELAKKALSDRNSTMVTISSGGSTGRYELTRAIFDELTKEKFLSRTEVVCKNVLKEAKLEWRDIDNILLVGGSTRMLQVKDMVKRISGIEPVIGGPGVSQDDAVCLGAALYAVRKTQESYPSLPGSVSLPFLPSGNIKDITSHSLGMVVENQKHDAYVNNIIIPKNAKVPDSFTITRPFNVSQGDKNEMEIYMLQGESSKPLECTVTKRYIVGGITFVNGGVSNVAVSYGYDSDAVITVTAKQVENGRELNIREMPMPEDLSWLGRPPKHAKPVIEKSEVLIAVDVSGSMYWPQEARPIDETKRAMRDQFIRKLNLQHTQVGLLLFADSTRVICKLTSDASALYDAISKIDKEGGSCGGGNDTDPFDNARAILSGPCKHKTIVVLTDGCWMHQDVAERRANTCKKSGINIMAIGFGSADETFLRRISNIKSLKTDLSHLGESMSRFATEINTSAKGLVH